MNKTEYHNRMSSTIQNSTFKTFPKNSLPKMVRQIAPIINGLSNVLEIPKWRLTVPNPILPQLYGLPKIHKPGNKMRPIVSNINAPSYNVAKLLVKEFASLPKPPGKYVKNTFEFVDPIKDLLIEDDEN